jgi:hypothetical protein
MHFHEMTEWRAPLCSYDGEDTGNSGFGGGPDGATAASDAAGGAAADSGGPGVVDIGAWDTGLTSTFGDWGTVALGGVGVAAGLMGGPASGVTALSALGIDVLNNGPVTTSAMSVAHDYGVLASDPALADAAIAGLFGTSTSDATSIGADPSGGGGSFDWGQYWLAGGPGIYSDVSGGGST